MRSWTVLVLWLTQPSPFAARRRDYCRASSTCIALLIAFAGSGYAAVEANGSSDDVPVAAQADTEAQRGLARVVPSENPEADETVAIAQPSAAATGPSPGNAIPAAAAAQTRQMASANNSILRNRLKDTVGSGEAPEFTYPDIDADPAQLYHERFGVAEDHDEFLFPWLMNLIFEDRWLLAEPDPGKALNNQLRRRMKIDIRDPDPDLANFPNGAYTIPKGRLYIENSPVGFYGASHNGFQPRTYQWEYLIRYGLTDNLELRIFSNGLTHQSSQTGQPATTGLSPLAFDFKVNFWEENTRYHLPAMGVEMYIQTDFGSTAFNNGTQPSLNLLFDQSLPLDISFEYNFGITGVQNNEKEIAYQFSYQWSLQRQVVTDFDVFVHGFYNAAALPRLIQFQNVQNTNIPSVTAIGVGAIWTINNRIAVFGSCNFGLTSAAPSTFGLMGFAVAF